MKNDTGMDPENALTAVEPEETGCGSVTLAESTAGEAAGVSEGRIDYGR